MNDLDDAIPYKPGSARRRAKAHGNERADDHWYYKCLTSTRGGVLSNHANVMLALREDPAWSDVVGFDKMRNQVMLFGPIPTHGGKPPIVVEQPRPWTDDTDDDDAVAQEWFQVAGLHRVGRDLIAAAITQFAREHPFHPITDWLDGLAWDGIPRVCGGSTGDGEIIPPWLTAYMGAEDTPYSRAVGAMWLKSAVARVFQPGCKADHVLILEGPQAAGKSTACRILCGDEWFTDSLHELKTRDAAAHLEGKWFVELAELDAMSRADEATLKAFLTRQVEKYRPAYGRREIESPRQCVFVGTTNKHVYLKDETGSRRFWPVAIGQIDLSAIEADRAQLWAEAVNLYRRDRSWHITDPELLRAAERQQDDRYDTDVWEEKIGEHLAGRTSVTIHEVMRDALGVATPHMDRAGQNRVMKALQRLGWQRGKQDSAGRRTWQPTADRGHSALS